MFLFYNLYKQKMFTVGLEDGLEAACKSSPEIRQSIKGIIVN